MRRPPPILLSATLVLLGLAPRLFGGMRVPGQAGPRLAERLVTGEVGSVPGADRLAAVMAGDLCALAGLALLAGLSWRTLFHRLPSRWWRGTAGGFALFLLLNAFVAAALQSPLAWSLLRISGGGGNAAAFQARRTALRDAGGAAYRFALLGNSQSQHALDLALLQREWGAVAVGESLAVPGSQAIDLLPSLRAARGAGAGTAILYVSELQFYLGVDPGHWPWLLDADSAADLHSLGLRRLEEAPGGAEPDPSATRRTALRLAGLGRVLPVLRLRATLRAGWLDADLDLAAVASRKRAAGATPEEQAATNARRFTRDARSDLQWRALERGLAWARERGFRVVVLGGQVNPLLADRMDPEVGRDFAERFAALRAAHPEALWLSPPELPRFTTEDFQDFTHLRPEARRTFTRAVVEQARAWVSDAPEPPARRAP